MLVALALFWGHLSIPDAWTPLLVHAVMASSYLLTLGILLSAIFGASRALPIAGKGYSASKSRELVVSTLVLGSSFAMLLAYLTICWFALF